MMFYIDKVNTWSPANIKWREVQSYVNQFRQTLIIDAPDADALVNEIRQYVEKLNEAFPRTQRLTVKKEGNFIFCEKEKPNLADQYVFTFHIEKVRQTYRNLNVKADEEEEGGEE